MNTATKQFTHAEQLDDRPWYRQFWPWFLISLPASVVVSGVVMIVLATRTPVSLVEADYYKEGLKINENIAAAELASELGVQAEIYIEPGYLRVDLNGTYADELSLQLIHPTAASLDKEYVLQPVGARRFEYTLAANEFAADGGNAEYRIRIEGESDKGVWTLASEAGGFLPSQSQAEPSVFRVLLSPTSLEPQ